MQAPRTHETSRVALVGAHLAINRNEALHDDGHHFTVGQCVLQPVPQHNNQRKTFPLLVGSRRGLGGLKENDQTPRVRIVKLCNLTKTRKTLEFQLNFTKKR